MYYWSSVGQKIMKQSTFNGRNYWKINAWGLWQTDNRVCAAVMRCWWLVWLQWWEDKDGAPPPGIGWHLFPTLCQWDLTLLSICVQIRAQGSKYHSEPHTGRHEQRRKLPLQPQTGVKVKGREFAQVCREDNLREDKVLLFFSSEDVELTGRERTVGFFLN